jgi:hypothetical protein
MISMTELTELHPVTETLSDDTTLLQEAIHTAFPYDDGKIIAKHVRTRGDVSWYRVNWYRNGSSGVQISRSRFLALRSTPEGFEVQDETVGGRPANVN